MSQWTQSHKRPMQHRVRIIYFHFKKQSGKENHGASTRGDQARERGNCHVTCAIPRALEEDQTTALQFQMSVSIYDS